jgi:hypothetical protein
MADTSPEHALFVACPVGLWATAVVLSALFLLANLGLQYGRLFAAPILVPMILASEPDVKKTAAAGAWVGLYFFAAVLFCLLLLIIRASRRQG